MASLRWDLEILRMRYSRPVRRKRNFPMIQLELLEANARPIYADRKPTRSQTDGGIRKKVMQPNAAFDEALWAAYHRSDKKGVTEELFRHSLVRLARRITS